jgi:hypothetical protein
MATTDIDEFVPDPVICKEFHITSEAMWRWDRDPAKKALGWPPPLKITDAKFGRNFRSRRAIEAFKANVIARALRTAEAA